MTDSTIVNHESRITKLELSQEVNMTSVMRRLQSLEEQAEQARVDKEQADRKAMADLRQELAAAQAALQQAGKA